MCTLDKSHVTSMTFFNTLEVNSMLDYDTLDIGKLDITASPFIVIICHLHCHKHISLLWNPYITNP
jgi:hypothetical protein